MQGIGRQPSRVRFEGFELDLRTGELRQDTGKVIKDLQGTAQDIYKSSSVEG